MNVQTWEAAERAAGADEEGAMTREQGGSFTPGGIYVVSEMGPETFIAPPGGVIVIPGVYSIDDPGLPTFDPVDGEDDPLPPDDGEVTVPAQPDDPEDEDV